MKFKFKNSLTALDFINSRPKVEQKRLIGEVRLMAIANIGTKITYEEILALPFESFVKGYSQFKEQYKETAFKKIEKTPGKKKPGIQFVKEAEFGRKGKEIEFSKVS